MNNENNDQIKIVSPTVVVNSHKSRREFFSQIFSKGQFAVLTNLTPVRIWQSILLMVLGRRADAQLLHHGVWKRRSVVNTLWVWGANNYGQLGLSDVTNRSSPVLIGNGRVWSKISAGNSYSFAIKTNGSLWGWGYNGWPSGGKLGTNNETNYSSPVQIGALTNWSEISAGYDHVLTVKTDGTLWAWGSNSLTAGALGNASSVNVSSPVQIGALTNWLKVSAGDSHSMAIKTDGTLWAWGWNTHGQLGFAPAYSPTQIGALTDWSKVFLGRGSAFGIKTDGTLWGWGNNRGPNGSSILGDNTTVTRSSPVQIGALTNWSKVAIGWYTPLAIKTDGTLWGWGENSQWASYKGMLGMGNYDNYNSPVQVGSLTTWADISVGNAHSAGIKTDGTLWTWGASGTAIAYGQLGTNTNNMSPIQIGSLLDWNSKIATRYDHSLIIKTDGTLWAFGSNGYGDLGVGSTTNQSSPVQVGAGTNWLSVATGPNLSAATKVDGTLWAWGVNAAGQLGIGNTSNRSSPVQVGALSDWSLVSCGTNTTSFFNHVAAIKTDGTLWVWGYNSSGQLGDGTSGAGTNKSSPIQIGGETNWSKVSAGNSHTIAIKTDGTLWTWGSNSSGQLGDGTSGAGTNKSSPIQIGGETNWSKIAAGSSFCAAIKSDGTIWTWGGNSSGQLGKNDTINRSSPVQIGTLTDWLDVSCTLTGVGALKTDNTLWMWGDGRLGGIGTGDTVSKSSPVQLAGTTWSLLSLGINHTIATKSDGSIWSWGDNVPNGQLGRGSANIPIQVGTLTDWSKVELGESSSYAIKTDGTLWAWGYGDDGRLGNSASGSSNRLSSPVQIGAGVTWQQISCYQEAVVGVRTDGTLWAWGSNSYGQVGDGTTTSRSSPVQIGALTTWSKVASGREFSIAIKTDGTLWAWGRNYAGALGNSSAVDVSSPIQIGSDTDWSYIEAGYCFASAVKSDGRIYSWGLNDIGQLGFQPPNSPVQVGAGTNWSKVCAALSHTVALKSDGTVWAWGGNPNGQLGDGTTLTRFSPVQVGAGTNWSDISTWNHTLAIKTDGTLWAWGYNSDGRLGDGTVSSRSSPVQIGSDTNWMKAAAGRAHSVALKTDGTLWAWGYNSDGRLGDGTVSSRSSPVQIGTSTDWTDITADGHTLARK